jgi:hypothetical protein
MNNSMRYRESKTSPVFFGGIEWIRSPSMSSCGFSIVKYESKKNDVFLLSSAALEMFKNYYKWDAVYNDAVISLIKRYNVSNFICIICLENQIETISRNISNTNYKICSLEDVLTDIKFPYIFRNITIDGISSFQKTDTKTGEIIFG